MVTFTIIAMIVIAIIVKGVTIGDTTTLYQKVRLGGMPVGKPKEVNSNSRQILFCLWPIYRFYRYINQDIITTHVVVDIPANKDFHQSGQDQADDEMVFPNIQLKLYMRVPKTSLHLSRFFREGFYTNGTVFGSEPEHVQALADHLQGALQASMITVFSRHHWQKLYYCPTDFEDEVRREVVKDAVVKDCGLNAPGSITVRIVKIELPADVKKSLAKKTIASQELEAYEIKTKGEAKATAEARQSLYAVDAANPQEAKLDALRGTEKVIIGSEITQAIQGLKGLRSE